MTVNTSDLPRYPPEIYGDLRIIMQIKDIFLLSYKHLEEYKRYADEQTRLVGKDYLLEQVQTEQDDISELMMELKQAKQQLRCKIIQNERLVGHMADIGLNNLNVSSPRRLAVMRSPHGRSPRSQSPCDENDPTDNLQINMIQVELQSVIESFDRLLIDLKNKTKNLIDHYQELFYLQLHFTVITTSICQQTMPLITDSISLVDRLFFWSYRPEFEFLRRSGDLSDKLKDVFIRVQNILTQLSCDTNLVKDQLQNQISLEKRFHVIIDKQTKLRNMLLRKIYEARQDMDYLEEENDRLVGYLVKIEPNFVHTSGFKTLTQAINSSQVDRTSPLFHPMKGEQFESYDKPGTNSQSLKQKILGRAHNVLNNTNPISNFKTTKFADFDERAFGGTINGEIIAQITETSSNTNSSTVKQSEKQIPITKKKQFKGELQVGMSNNTPLRRQSLSKKHKKRDTNAHVVQYTSSSDVTK